MEKKFKTREELAQIVKRLRKMGYSSGLINGVFDILHEGHIQIIEEAKVFSDILIIALNSDKSTAAIKGRNRPILKEHERIRIISSIEGVDFVTIFDEETAAETLRIIRPDFHIKGGEYRGKPLPEEKITMRYGIKTILLGDKKINSTTDIIQKIKKL
ncbi:MAG: adenylyltransferase/cytidyltransferase family protein [Deltaproteobacteria bacterium]|nr:adenylyltransferase/cytidyltransferase family protein [Deltaproteobacteria bacterium]